MKKINWTVRLKNPLWWAETAGAVFLPLLAYFGLNWEDLTTWKAVGELLLAAVQNPVVVVSVAISLLNAVNDPTTAGLGDSQRALGYTTPFRDKERGGKIHANKGN